jgi:glucose/arabinose dehydrogenase
VIGLAGTRARSTPPARMPAPGRRLASLVALAAALAVAGCQGPGARTPTLPPPSATPAAAGPAVPPPATPAAAAPTGPPSTAAASPVAPPSAAATAAAAVAAAPTAPPSAAASPSATRPPATTPAAAATSAPPAATAAPTKPTAASAAPTAVATKPAAVTKPAAPAAPAGPFNPARLTLAAERVGAGFSEPLLLTHAPDGSLYVLEKVGRVKTLDGAVFLDISGRVTSPPLRSYEREQGLLGLAFHPRFAENGYLYVHYNGAGGRHVLSRFTARDGRADPGSEKVLLTQDQPETNFNGGMILFGADGYLYMGLGTGGTAVRLQDLAQNLGSLLGKILRIDVDSGDPYAVPPDNPFVGRGGGARGEVWAYGLRNPYRFSFDRATGDLFVASPGQFTREWVNRQPGGTPGGRNFGWPVLEGSLCWNATTCDRRGLEPAILEYNTYDGGNCAIIGGYVYRGRRSPLLDGAYLFGDFCGGRVYAAARGESGVWVRHELLRVGGLISSFGEDREGEVYVTDISNGIVYRLVATPR